MPDFISAWLGKEAYKHPAFFLVAILLMGSVAGLVINPFVMAEDFNTFKASNDKRLKGLEQKICDVDKTVKNESLEGQLRSIESDIWKLERLVENEQSNGRDEERLGELRSDKGALNRKLEALAQDEKCITN